MENKIVVVTGANGFLGRKCCELFSKHGYTVRALVRDPSKNSDLKKIALGGIFKCILPGEIDVRAFEGEITAVVHCAYETQYKNIEQAKKTNIEGTERLIELSEQLNVKQFVFISSLAAHENAKSFYGQSKYQLEQKLQSGKNQKYTIIKPGTIIGSGGVFARTRELVTKVPILPVFFGFKKSLQTIWIDDLCEGILSAVEKCLSGVYVLGEQNPVLIVDFYKGIASLDGKIPRLVAFPGNLALFIVSILERLGLRLPITSENLLGIKYVKIFSSESDLKKLGVNVRSFSQSIKTLSNNKDI